MTHPTLKRRLRITLASGPLLAFLVACGSGSGFSEGQGSEMAAGSPTTSPGAPASDDAQNPPGTMMPDDAPLPEASPPPVEMPEEEEPMIPDPAEEGPEGGDPMEEPEGGDPGEEEPGEEEPGNGDPGGEDPGNGDPGEQEPPPANPNLPPGTHPDIVQIIDVQGDNPGGDGWKDSYSVGDKCYCDTTFDHNIGNIKVDTPAGRKTVREVCNRIGKGPGRKGNPIYNDVQCGNGPINDAGDEKRCPGRVDIGRKGCGHIGPKWDLSVFN